MSIVVTDAPERERFEAHDGDELVGIMTYQLTGKIIAITHTEAFQEGRGIGGLLAKHAMDDAVAQARTVIPICPYLQDWLTKHAEYAAVVATKTKKVK